MIRSIGRGLVERPGGSDMIVMVITMVSGRSVGTDVRLVADSSPK